MITRWFTLATVRHAVETLKAYQNGSMPPKPPEPPTEVYVLPDTEQDPIEYNPIKPDERKTKFSHDQKRHWQEWIERTNLHGPRELFYSSIIAERVFWVTLILLLIGWTCSTSSLLLKDYLSQKTTFDTRAISPSDEEVFKLLEIVFCSTHWINGSKARDMGLDKDLLEYASLLLDLVNGDGLDLLKHENLSDPEVRQKYNVLHSRLYGYLATDKRIKSMHEFYVELGMDYMEDVTKRQLCPSKKGNFCFYNFTSQKSVGYTIRKGRVCQQLQPQRDKKAALDPLQNELDVEFHLKIDHSFFPQLYDNRNYINASVRMYLGELISTGLSSNTGLSFDDIIFIPVENRSTFCETRISATLYHLTRLSTKAKPCKAVAQTTRHPENYPADTCRLKCVDEVYYKKNLECSLFDPLYRFSDKEKDWQICSPVQLYDAMNSVDMTSVDQKLYEQCDTHKRCGAQLPCDVWIGELIPTTTCSSEPWEGFIDLANTTAYDNSTRIRLTMNPLSMLIIKERLLYTFAYTYSSIGGVMGLTLGASIVSVTHFALYCIKHVGKALRFLATGRAV